MKKKILNISLFALLVLSVINPAFAFQAPPPPGLPIDGFISLFIAVGAFLGFRFFNKKEK